MIEILLTNTLDNSIILNKLKQKYKLGSKHLVIVPDRFTMSYERAILENLKLKGTFDIEVSGFSRLANKMLDKFSYKLLDKQSEIMLLRKVIEDCKDELVCFNRSSNCVGFAEEVYAAISEIRNSGISVAKLEEILPKITGKVATKTRDIILIYKKYVSELQTGTYDGTKKLEALSEYILTSDLVDRDVFISDFTSFSKVEYDIVLSMMKTCKSVTICIVDGVGENSHIYPKEVVARIKSLAELCDENVKITRENKPLKSDFEALANNLFTYCAPSLKPDGKSVKIVFANNQTEELRQCARTINELVKNGERYRQIAVVCCDLTAYSQYISRIFKDYDIAFYLDSKDALINQSITNLVVCGIKVAINNFKKNDVIQLAKEELLDFAYDEVCVFDNYCRRFGIEYSRFLSPFKLGDEDSGREIAENIRQRLLKIMQPFLNKGTVVNDYIDEIEAFFKLTNADEACKQHAEKQAEKGFLQQSGITAQSYDKVIRILEQSRAMLGASAMTLSKYLKIFLSAVESVELSGVPLSLDSVFVGEMGQSRFENIEYLFILGASEGHFPIEHGDSGIIAERENKTWNTLGVFVEPNVKMLNYKEKLEALMVMLKPSKMLIISYPQYNYDGSIVQPAMILESISDITGVSASMADTSQINAENDDFIKYCSAKDNILQELLDILNKINLKIIKPTDIEYDTLDAMYALVCETYGRANVDELLLGRRDSDSELSIAMDSIYKNGHTSSSQIERYFSCPFKHYAEYILRAKRREEANLEVSDIGTILHAIAEKFFAYEDCCEISEKAVLERVKKILEDELERDEKLANIRNMDNGSAMLYSIYRRAGLMISELVVKMRRSKFRPYKLESSFGMKDKKDNADVGDNNKIVDGNADGEDEKDFFVLNKDGKKINICGKIDRIDTCGNNAIIIDYKSKSSIDFDAVNILCGERIQMFIYLDAVAKEKKLTPVGVFYFLMSNKLTDKDKRDERYKYNGVVGCDNEKELSDFDNGFDEDGEYRSLLFPISRKVTKKATTIEGNILTKSGLISVGNYVLKLIEKAVGEISEGYIEASPVSFNAQEPSTCKYCEYKNICHIEKNPQKIRRVAKISFDDLYSISRGQSPKTSAKGEENAME